MATTTTSGSSGGFDPSMITSGAQAAATIAQTISNIIDQTKRRQFEQAMTLLSNQQQIDLANNLQKAQSEDVKLQLLSSALLQYTISAQQSADKNNTTMIIITAAFAAL
ncbi:MAG TPA: hypothetical protein VFV08_07085, partial [Puia sp.]|nr:hypothetical protein [Puia sp.]